MRKALDVVWLTRQKANLPPSFLVFSINSIKIEMRVVEVGLLGYTQTPVALFAQ